MNGALPLMAYLDVFAYWEQNYSGLVIKVNWMKQFHIKKTSHDTVLCQTTAHAPLNILKTEELWLSLLFQ